MPRPQLAPRPLPLGLAALVFAAACTPSSSESRDKQVEAKPEAESDAAKPVSEREAKAVFEAWLAAQVATDLDAYATVYAEDFTGIKRNGHNTKELERQAWLDAKSKQFERGFSITATGLELSDAEPREPGAITARFTQRWATPTFADIGPKELVIARRGDVAMVTHEEMISSHVTRRKGQTDSPISVLEIGGAHYAVLGAARVGWVDDDAAPTLLNSDTVTKPLVEERVSKTMREWVGRELEVSSLSGTPCQAKVERLEVAGRIYSSPDLDDSLWEIWEEREPTDAELAPPMWSMIKDELFLLGKLDGCTGDLALPTEAEPDPAAATVSYALNTDPGAKLTELATTAFRALPDYVQEQSNYERDMKDWAGEGDAEAAEDPGPWDVNEESSEVTVQLWSAGDERLLFRSVSVGESCGDWTASMWALWKMGEGDALELVGTGPESGDFSGTSALVPTRLLRWHDNLWMRTSSELYEIQPKGDAMLIHATEPVFFGCPC